MVDIKTASEPDETLAFDLIERMFFGYRDFVGVADTALAETPYGRAHHRVLHFVDRHPGLTVGELLGILKVTKQGVSRVLKTLVDDAMITVEPGREDRREKRLTTTEAGHRLARRLAVLQTARIESALAPLPPGSRGVVAAFLANLVDADEREAVIRRIDRSRE